MKTNILAQFSLAIECLKWFRSTMWAKWMHTESTNKSQYFVLFKTITRRLDDERAEKDFYFSEDFSFIHIVYNNFRMNKLKSMTQRVWNIIIIINTKNKISSFKSIYNLFIIEFEIFKKYFDEFLIKKFIMSSFSTTNISILCIKKSKNDLKLCVNYKKLNVIMIKNRYLIIIKFILVVTSF
jgi:hypothetical protein